MQSLEKLTDVLIEHTKDVENKDNALEKMMKSAGNNARGIVVAALVYLGAGSAAGMMLPTSAYAQQAVNSVKSFYENLSQNSNEISGGKFFSGLINISSPTLKFSGIEWENYYFDQVNYGPKFKKILYSDLKEKRFDELDRYLIKNRNKISRITLSYEGYMIIDSDSLGRSIIFPLSKSVAEQIEALP